VSDLVISSERVGSVSLLRLQGRLDAHGADLAEPAFQAIDYKSAVVVDLGGVPYLSSAGIRLFVALQKNLQSQGGKLVLAEVLPYCRDVLKISGLDQFFTIEETVTRAFLELGERTAAFSRAAGRFVYHHGVEQAGSIEVLGHIGNVLASRITPDLMVGKKFSAKEYSIGLGALGPSDDDVLPLLGEMITIGGTMVWLPTDGNDTPDFLVPRQDSDSVLIRTGFNVSLAGDFNDYVEFEAASERGATLSEVYESLMAIARERRPDFRGAIGLAMRAEVGELYGCGVVKSPIATNAPENGKLITDPENYEKWFEYDQTPRLRDVSALICGIGVDLSADLSVFDVDYLNSAFYINPGNQDSTGLKLHNHGVCFQPFPLGEKPWSLEREIQSIVTEGEFVDMRHLFDRTTIQWALIGVVYVEDFRPDSSQSVQAGKSTVRKE
jgi:anti-anti-sigma factor